MKKIALITGISGQDGAYLAKFLLSKNYIVIGADRRSARDDKWRLRKLGIENKIIIEDFELSEITQIIRIFNKYKISEVYNLAAQSFVGSSFLNPISTSDVTGLGVLEFRSYKKFKYNLSFTKHHPQMFGDVLETPQTMKTPFNPVSPYAISKLFAHYTTINYRKAYNLFAVSGICFNHESPLRGEDFITRKITTGLAKIKAGKLNCLEVGNIDAKRDWGFAGDYVNAMWLMLQQKKAKDYIIATGKMYTVRQFIE